MKTLLLVEDEALIALNESDILTKHGYMVIKAMSPEKAIAAVKQKKIDLILMDIDLGENRIDGTQTAEEILEIKELPIVFLTSHAEKEMVEKVKGITRYGYVLKNAGEFVLLEAITMAFELFEAHQTLLEENRERKRAEEKLQETAAQYSHLMENSIDAAYFLSEEGKVLNVNKTACTMTGYTKEELLSLTIDDIDPNYPSKHFIEFWNNKPEGTTVLFETLHRHKTGTIIPVEINGIFFRQKGEKYLFGVARDIRERKAKELALQESREKYKRIFNNSPHLLIEVDADTYEVLSCNPAMAKSLGYPQVEIEGVSLKNFLPPDIFASRADRGFEALRTGEIVEFQDERKGKHFLNTFVPQIDSNKRTILAITKDITEIVLAQKKIEEKEQNFKALSENAGVGITVIQNDRIEYLNSTAEKISGYPKQEIQSMGMEGMLQRIHPEDREYITELYNKQKITTQKDQRQQNIFSPIQYRHIRKDDTLLWTETYTSIITYNGNPALLVIHSDITERKMLEEKLRLSLEDRSQ